MKGIICYYSGTGNTKLACEYIRNNVKKCDFVLHDLVKDGIPDISSYDLIGFAAWTDFLGLPEIMIKYISKFKGNGKKAFVFNTYGNISGATLSMMKSSVEKSGFVTVAGHSLHTPENVPSLILLGMKKEDAPYQNELNNFNDFISSLDSICNDIKNNSFSNKKFKLSLKERFSISLPRTTSKLFMDKKIVNVNTCTKCGLCVKICPYNAITMNGLPLFDEKKCYGCWVCYNRCPVKSIHTKKYNGVGHYSKPNDLLSEKLKNN